MPPNQLEDRIQAVRWKLGLLSPGDDVEHLRPVWDALARDPNQLATVATAVAEKLCRPLAGALRAKLTGETSPNYDWANDLSETFIRWVKANEVSRSPKMSGLIRRALELPPPTAVRPPPLPPPLAVSYSPPPPPRPTGPPKPVGLHPDAGRTNPLPRPTSAPPPVPVMTPPPLPPASPSAAWQWKPIPDTPDPFPENVTASLTDPPTGFRGFGARVRGKKHKHDGTNGDDWFAFVQAGPWTVIAVADGAGSKKLSRIGAEAATTTAVRTLFADLQGHSFIERTTRAEWSAALKRPASGADFEAADVQAVCSSLHAAMRHALTAVEQAAEARHGRADIEASLGRPVEVGDLSCTLLLAVFREVEVDGKAVHFIMGCQVGDGMIGAIHKDGHGYPVGSADSGGHAGETEFLTSTGKTDAAFLARKTDVKLLSLQALLVMTDGVADDYFPTDHLPRLWGDLVVNGIPDLIPPTDREIANALSGTPLTPEQAAEFEYSTSAEVVEADPRTLLYLRSSETFARELGIDAADLVKRPAALWAGRKPLGAPTPQDRLRLWLDAYHVRGSFDDRTLVVVHREGLS